MKDILSDKLWHWGCHIGLRIFAALAQLIFVPCQRPSGLMVAQLTSASTLLVINEIKSIQSRFLAWPNLARSYTSYENNSKAQ